MIGLQSKVKLHRVVAKTLAEQLDMQEFYAYDVISVFVKENNESVL